MSQHEHRDTVPAEESLLGLFGNFFPAAGEFNAFVGGVLLGIVLLGVLVGLAVLINGHLGIWPTF